MEIVRLTFEVTGIVQGVCFRAYTVDYAKSLGLVGWVKNTIKGSVQGEAEGSRHEIDQLKHWLRFVGSPASTIHDAKFEEFIQNARSFSGFTVRHD
jgi:acylphosphatase